MRVTKTEINYNCVIIRMTQRIETAIDAYNIMLKLNTEQETSGEFDNLLHNISLVYEGKDFNVDIFPEMFPGRADVIFELTIHINMHTGSKLDTKDIDTEPILGTIFKEIRNHFDFYYRSCPKDTSLDIVKHYFRGY